MKMVPSRLYAGYLLTRRACRSHSGLQAGLESRRRSPSMVIPLARARTQRRSLLEAHNRLISNDRPLCAFRQATLSKLAVELLQRRFAALLPKGTQRLNAIYMPAGLITALYATAVLLFGVVIPANAGNCDCSCSRYASLLESLSDSSSGSNEFLDICSGACANAWSRCEAARERKGAWPNLGSEREPERLESTRDDHRPLVQSKGQVKR